MNTKFYTVEELLPLIDANATAAAMSIADAYVVGIEHKAEFYPVNAVSTPAEADEVTAELAKSLEFHFTPVETDFEADEAQMLEGFTFVPNKGMAAIYVGDSDKTNRIYLKGGFESLLGVKAGTRIIMAFNPHEQAFAIVKPTSKAITDEMRMAGYFVSRKKDVTCAKMFREFGLEKFRGKTFYADKASLSGNVVIFRQ